MEVRLAELPPELSGLLSPDAYPHPVQSIELVETHVSWVLLTGEFAYKIKRPVRYAFVDLSTYERRAFFCSEELRLNRRFAPDLYLEVSDIREGPGGVRIGGTGGRVIERCVRMRQFPREQELDALLEHDSIGAEALEAFGRDLAMMHAKLPAAGPEHKWGKAGVIRGVVLENLDEYLRAATSLSINGSAWSLRPAFESQLDALGECMAARRRLGRVRECHGDLHTRNIVQWGGKLVPFDCMEFEPAYRWVDVAEEIALLLADMEARQRPRHANAFLNGYLSQSGDYQACRVLNFYKAHRALVRAKIAALESASATDDSAVRAATEHHDSQLAAARADLSGKNPQLILMVGLPASGKTWLARRLAPEVNAVHLRSDVERKRLAGLAEHASSGSATGEGLYTSESSARLYQHLATCSKDMLAGRQSVIVDATFLKRTDRALFYKLADELDVTVQLIDCEAPLEVLRERIVARARAGGDASEATLEVLEWQSKKREPISDDEALRVVRIDTTRADALRRLALHFTVHAT